MSARNAHPAVTAAEAAASGHPWLYACPECGELPRSCFCLRRSVRDRIADAIHFPVETGPHLPFLAMCPAAGLEAPLEGADPTGG